MSRISTQRVIAVLRKAGFNNSRTRNTRDDKTRANQNGFMVSLYGDDDISVGHWVRPGKLWSEEAHRQALEAYRVALAAAGISARRQGNRLLIARGRVGA